MTKLVDFEFESNTKKSDFETGPVETGSNGSGPEGSGKWWILVAVVLLLAIALVFWFRRSEPEAPPERAPAPAVEAPEPTTAEAEPKEPLVLPALSASDVLVRELVSGLSSHPRLAAWLATDELVRRFTASIANISEGATPKPHLPFLKPSEPFSVRQGGDSMVPSAKSYARYDTVADVISSLDVEGTVELYHQLQPLIDESFAELGYPQRQFHDVLVEALDHLLATPIIDPDVELVETVAAYEYASPELEGLSSAQKQLLRTGPENVRKIQQTLRELRAALLSPTGS